MRFLRAIFAAVLAMLFLVSTNTCALASAFAGNGAACCEDEAGPGAPQDEAPCGGGCCAPCATLESGVNLAALAPLTICTPVWTQECDLADLMRLLARGAFAPPAAVPPDPAKIPSPPWPRWLRTALPVRGPSLTA